MKLTELLNSTHHQPEFSTLQVPPDWLQGRSVFGGLQAAFAVQCMRQLIPSSVPLRALQVSFIAPVPGGPVSARAKVLRSGKNVTHVEAQLFDADSVLASLIGVFGAGRESVVQVHPAQPAVDDSQSTPMTFVPGLVPSFTQHFHARWLRGGLPFSGSQSTDAVVALDLLDDGPCSELHLIAIADFIPPVALSLLQTATPGSSLTWLLELTSQRFADWSGRGWRVDAQLQAGHAGYTSQATRIWSPDGELAALSQQSMVVFG